MSLYSLIHDQAHIRAGFRERIKRPPGKLGRQLLVVPRTKNYRPVGTAFDYLLRFTIERLNTNAVTSTWVAEDGVFRLGMRHGKGSIHELWRMDEDPARIRCSMYLREAKTRHRAFLKSGKLTKALLASVLRLAYLDVIIRAGVDRVDWHALESPNPEDLEDLRAMIGLVNEHIFTTTHTCILNPTFGAASELVGGADADLMLDNRLVDIKATKEPRLDMRDFYQLVGYYLLYGLDGLEIRGGDLRNSQIESLGIYFARFGFLWEVPVNEVVPEGSESALVKWFVEVACPSKSRRAKLVRKFRGPLAIHVV